MRLGKGSACWVLPCCSYRPGLSVLPSLWCWAGGGLGRRSRPWLCPRETDKHQLNNLPTCDDGCEAIEQRVWCPRGEVCSAPFCHLGTGLRQDLDRSPRAVPFLLPWAAAWGWGSSGPGHHLGTACSFLTHCSFTGFEA